jgi:hypothetical protein
MDRCISRNLAMKTVHILLIAILFGAVPFCGCVSEPGTGPGTSVPTTAAAGIPSPTTSFPPLPMVLENISVNWAGYAIQTSFNNPQDNAVDSVEASWNVPPVICPPSMDDYSSAFWVGIDGISSKSVEQIGTDSDCIQGVPTYYAWYEAYPRDSVTLDINITPGDEVHAKVEFIGNNTFRYTIRDMTNQEMVSITEAGSVVAERSSAEWIAEAPFLGRRILPLADFGPVDFMNATVAIHGESGPISGRNWQYRPIVMEARGGPFKATPTGLAADGSSFSIIWDHS